MTEPLNILDLCRCCLSEAGVKNLSAPYTHEGTEEIYTIMLQDVFDIFLSPTVKASYTICEKCASVLRTAALFKQQVLACQARLIDYCQYDVKNEEKDPCTEVDDNMGTKSGSDDDQPLARLNNEAAEEIQETTKKSSQIYFCDMCSKQFTYKGSLEIHLKAHRGEKTLPCLICTTKYLSHKDLNKHLIAQHYDGKTKHYICQICSQTFGKRKELKLHVNVHFKDRFKCEHCSKIFARKKGLDSHLKSHSSDKKYKCNICNKSFGHNQTLKVHKYVHTGEKPHICEQCGFSFTQSNHLKRHIFRIHSGVKKFSCNICQKKFSSKTYMLTHERLHKGDKPFTCDVCKKKFTLYTSLKVHLKLHTGVKPYTCAHCKRNFAQMASLKLHERSHTGEKPFSCSVCRKPFSDNGYLKIHMRLHTGERPFECGLCKRSFREKGQLKRHTRIHTGEKYTCATCNKQVSNLNKHLRVHVKSLNNVNKRDEFCKNSGNGRLSEAR